MKIVSANLNGIRSASSKGFFTWMSRSGADVVCVQEVKAQEADLTEAMKNPGKFRGYFHFAAKKGYSGVGLFCRREPDRVIEGIGHEGFDAEGRFVRADFGKLSVVSVYFPSGSSSEERQQAKFVFLDEFLPLMEAMRAEGREFILCGDWNIAHQPIDLKNWRSNQKNSGFLPEEREWLTKAYGAGWVDVYRQLYPKAEGEGYTWWSARGAAYDNNVGWRIDLQVATPGIGSLAREGSVYKKKKFSDHAPLIVDYDYVL